MFRINRNFLILILLYFLGFTGFLGGPYSLAKFFFFFFLLGTLAFALFVSGAGLFAKRIFFGRHKKQKEKNSGTIKVDAKIVE